MGPGPEGNGQLNMVLNMSRRLDSFGEDLARLVVHHPWKAIIFSILLVLVTGVGIFRLDFASDYRVYFSEDNPELKAFEQFQQIYSKNDNILFVVRPRNDAGLTPDVAAAIEKLTEEAWQIPYVLRVDSITNFQSSRGEGDDLIVENLIIDGASLQQEDIDAKLDIALAEPLLRESLISSDSRTFGVNAVLQLPQQSLEEVPAATAVARELRRQLQADYPDLDIALTGYLMLNNAFFEAGIRDMMTLFPVMYAVLLIIILLTLRSLSAALTTFAIILFSTLSAMGIAGILGVQLTPPSMVAPNIILTLAVADSVHILLTLRFLMRRGMEKRLAIIEAVRLNFMAVFLTSLTTVIGFLALNSLDSPPFRDLGNMTAVGIVAAWVYSISLLPALTALLPFKNPSQSASTVDWSRRMMDRLIDAVIGNYRSVFWGMSALAVILGALIPTMEFNDRWTKYFDENIEFRRDSDFASKHLGGLYPVEFSLKAEGENGINAPSYLKTMDAFVAWLRTQPEVVHVLSITDIVKRLNKNIHGDDPTYHRLPNDRELSAQNLLLYELSLPYGLDLNNRINLDKSEARITATLKDISTLETRAFVERSERWLRENTPSHMHAEATGATIMFSLIAKRNIESMLSGTLTAILLIALILIVSLGSFSLGLVSLIPNALPVIMSFGLWAILVGFVGVASATITATSLGIIVDNTIHLLTKYVRGVREQGLSTPDAIRHAYRTVGPAVTINAFVLGIGFAVLAFSSYRVSNELGLLTAIAIIVALIVDFLLLPALLMVFFKGSKHAKISTTPSTSS